jgi:aspartyl-tRNA(Asn)/glutamyl-tRNA(Gln) amidotransferase subunit C
MSLDRAQVAKIALLARLSLSEQELDSATEQLGKIVDLFRQLEQVNTDGIEPLVHAIELHNVLAEDQVAPSIDRELALKNAPSSDDECFRVNAVL